MHSACNVAAHQRKSHRSEGGFGRRKCHQIFVEVRIFDVERKLGIGSEVAQPLETIVFSCTTVTCEEMPPNASPYFRLEWGKPKVLAFTMQSKGLSYANGQTIQDPDTFATVVKFQCKLRATR